MATNVNNDLPDGFLLDELPSGFTIDTQEQAQQDTLLGKTYPEIYASTPYRIAKSMKDPIDALAQLTPYGLSKVTSAGGMLENPVSRWLMKEHENVSKGLQEEERQYQGSRNLVAGGDAGFDVARLAGNVINPITYLPAARLAKPVTLGQKIATGAGVGAIQGGMQPVYDDGFLKSKLQQVGLGATIGGVIPVGAKAFGSVYNFGKDIVSAITPNGYKSLTINALKQRIGKENVDAVAEGLIRAKAIVPGAEPTASEALAGMPAGSPIIGLQKASFEQAGGASKEAGERWLDQSIARAKMLSFAGTDDDLINAINAREVATAPFYKAVDQSTANVRVSPVMSYLNETIQKNAKRSSVLEPLIKIRDGLIVATETGSKLENRPQMIKSLLDEVKDMLGKKTVDGQPQYDVAVLARTKELLDKQLSSAVPEYKQANDIFKSMSDPINQMQVGRYLQRKLVNPVGTETPRSFINALDDAAKSIKKSTGMSRFNKIEDVLSPENAAAAKAVATDLERSLSSKSPLQRTNVTGGVAGEVPQAPHILSRPVLIMNTALKHVFGDVEEKSHKYMTDLYLNPKQLGLLLKATPPKDRGILLNAVMKYGKAGAEAASEASKAAAIINAGKLAGGTIPQELEQ